MELCSTGTQCTIDPQFYCSRCQEGSGRVRRGFLSWGPNLDDFFSQSRHCQCVLFCQRSAVNYDIQMSSKLPFLFLLLSLGWLALRFMKSVRMYFPLWSLPSLVSCCGTLFWASSQHAPLSASVLFPWTFSWPEFQCFLVRVNKLFWKSKTWEFIWESNNSKNVNKFRQRTLGVIVFLLLFW